jgi:hypothetical protein
MQPLTFDQLHALPTVVDLMTAARALGIGRTKAYQLAHADQFPVRIIRVGTNYHIPTADLLKVLGVASVPQLPRATTENSDTGARNE